MLRSLLNRITTSSTAFRRSRRYRNTRLDVEALEARDNPSAVAEVEPNNSFAAYQPLNKDATYSVTSSIASLSDVDFFGFYVKKDSPINVRAVAAQLTGDQHTEFDPTLGLFDPGGNLVRADDDSGRGGGSFWAAQVTYTATVSGVWRVAVSHYNDFQFNGSNTRPSYDPNNPNSGPGVHTGAYVLNISGASRPFIEVVTPANLTDFLITDVPRMPEITVRLAGIAPGSAPIGSVTWKTEISSGPGVPGGVVFAHQVATFTATPIDASVQGSLDYTPNFGNQIIGGKLTFTASTTIAGVAFQATPLGDPADPADDQKFRILGTQPAANKIETFLRSNFAVPGNWPAGAGYDYYSVLLAIMRQESFGGLQFQADGSPVFNTTNDGGAGLFQITPPSAQDVWNWQTNVRSGVKIFNGKLTEAVGWINDRHFTQETTRIIKLRGLPSNTTARVVSTVSRDEMILREAIQRYNGGNAFRLDVVPVTQQTIPLGNGRFRYELTFTWALTTNNYHNTILGSI